jgi:hypothetical protein
MHMQETRKPARKPRTATKPATKPALAKRKTTVRQKAAEVLPPPTQPSPDSDREQRVRLAAYLRAERRGFVGGHEEEDWFAAEAEVGVVTPSRHRPRPATGKRRRVTDSQA